jgi:predicted membrane GTPase involved in stress response
MPSFAFVYVIGKDGIAVNDIEDQVKDLTPLFDLIINYFEGPDTTDSAKTQFLVTNLAYDSYVGQVAVGRLDSGSLNINTKYSLCTENEIKKNIKLSALYTFNGLERKSVDTLESLSAVEEKVKTIGCQKHSKKGCNGKSAKCITHNLWDELETHINIFFQEKNLSDLINKTENRI